MKILALPQTLYAVGVTVAWLVAASVQAFTFVGAAIASLVAGCWLWRERRRRPLIREVFGIGYRLGRHDADDHHRPDSEPAV